MKQRIVVPKVQTQCSTPKKTNNKNAPMPKIIKPTLPPIQDRKLVDSSRPQSAISSSRSDETETTVEVEHLPLHSVKTIKRFEDELINDPATSRSTSILNYLHEMDETNPEPSLDKIIQLTKSWKCDSIISVDFRVYHILTQALFTLIRQLCQKQDYSKTLFKALSICIHIIPSSDHESLLIVLKLMHKMSQSEQFDTDFSNCFIIKPLVFHSFEQVEKIPVYSAAILRHVGTLEVNAKEMIQNNAIKLICQTLRTKIRRERFTPEMGLYFYQVIDLFNTLFQFISDFTIICRYTLPLNLMDISMIYSNDITVQSASSKALSLLMTQQECVEVLEDEDITPLFFLMKNKNKKIAQASCLSLSNALNHSSILVENVCSMAPPFGVFGLCEILKETNDTNMILSCLRCLAKTSELKQGMDSIMLYIQYIVPLLDTPMDDVDVWTESHMIVANALIILKNATIINNNKIANMIKGKLRQLMNFGVVDYVIDLMKVLMKTPLGKEICNEVSDFEEVQFVFMNKM
ncbi:hypothetical protein GPJ56_000991 [Histomonas meleagridis]|uniref:uncharacterized protein n=1 Tax=Histomonas meleagridis TaxID=135588 RepID=UPI00355A4642|nr:hypothetical protein GPJ56_000991 [Histomonas meleagridis]KAH0803828.1 hypothetical protein GO595_002658 [Histomonas meleagridis]